MSPQLHMFTARLALVVLLKDHSRFEYTVITRGRYGELLQLGRASHISQHADERSLQCTTSVWVLHLYVVHNTQSSSSNVQASSLRDDQDCLCCRTSHRS